MRQLLMSPLDTTYSWRGLMAPWRGWSLATPANSRVSVGGWI